MSDIYPIAVPKWGIEMVEGTVNIWNKQEGDSVARGDEVFEMESDKITNVWDSPVDGVLRRIIAREGDAHPVGALLGVITTGEVEDAAIDAFIADFSGDSSDATAAAEPAPAAAASASGPNDAYTRSSPAVRKLADKLGVDLNVVTGTGRRGRITEDDVRAAAGGNDSAGDDVEIIPMSATRKTIARRLTQAKQDIPHYYLGVEWQLDGLLAHRSALNESGGTRVSVNDLLVYCVSRALLAEPRVNINVVGDEIHQFKSANVAVAVATDDGLYPVTLRGVETMSPVDIAEATTAAAARAGSGTLSSEDLSGGSFTVSNLGMFGIDQFTAIINPPMGAILALGAAKQQTVVENGEIKIATVLQATLSCDHRGIDGAVGAAFLLALKQEIDALG
jgi:pyruvate dehydrogenase E2 component (dihydrolipoyllysine-residue acetyltransferase)